MPAYMVDALKIPISQSYLEGREAARRKVDYYDGNPHPEAEMMKRLDWFIGHDDETQGVPVEFRQEEVAA